MAVRKTPGVYIVEKNAFPNSVVEVATAVPAFVGHTERADDNGKSLAKVPKRITSMSEFRRYFGGASEPEFTLVAVDGPPTPPGFRLGDNPTHTLSRAATDNQYLLHQSMLLFFQNGGGPCYIVSVGNYSEGIAPDPLLEGIEALVKEQEPTMLVIPDAARLSLDDFTSVQQQMLKHCGETKRNRIAVLDVHAGHDHDLSRVDDFRDRIGANNLDFAAAYYPWLNTTIVQAADLTFDNLDAEGKQELTALQEAKPGINPEASQAILDLMREQVNVMPPSAAMAGIYTAVDNSRGVWKAPANVSLNSVVSPTRNVTHAEQENLNVDVNGKSVNAIRSFVGEGVLVWGARTLDGNSLDWRYIQVRRTMIMLEESIRLAVKAYVFEPNDANTWVTVKGTIRNFLTGVWKRGGLAGASPDDAFQVFVGLGETMTPEDIREGKLLMTVLVAVTRPAEFIEITFQQQMQQS